MAWQAQHYGVDRMCRRVRISGAWYYIGEGHWKVGINLNAYHELPLDQVLRGDCAEIMRMWLWCRDQACRRSNSEPCEIS